MTMLTAMNISSERLMRLTGSKEKRTRRATKVGETSAPFARFAIFVVYFWFGALKLAGVSPAGPLVSALWQRTIPFIPLDAFMMLFALFEMLVGSLFLIPRLERAAIGLLLLHISMTVMPLVLLPGMVWKAFMEPSLEGQYIIKNIVIVALALSIGERVRGDRRDRAPARVLSFTPEPRNRWR